LLARSELFPENFLVPVAAIAARRGSLRGPTASPRNAAARLR